MVGIFSTCLTARNQTIAINLYWFDTTMKIIKTSLPDVVVVEPDVFADVRGKFMETFRVNRYQEAGIPGPFVQDNFSRSQRGVLRGLHYQLQKPQGKLVQVLRGEVFDVAVDIRRGSPTFRQWTAAILSEENNRQMYIPPGFAHGFLVLSETVDFVYKCTDYYDRDDECGVLWSDPAIGIRWPGGEQLLSAKDSALPELAAIPDEKLPVYQASP
ncbi:MAG: dTDP-4-dehydrorhamnose 3 5-epimerase [Gammaproteobacteria bacterium]|nr:MAG: dTDP-4-dehydrorhamnose 3 5-epimerase [Gammaproteobacteria bacterium]TND06709.1 MAG: dTDP-4-dehydrorhamnose 3,5-epimerase [Gammaproteobacteria bacterium]